MKIETVILLIKILTPVITGVVTGIIYIKYYKNSEVNGNKEKTT